MMIALMILMCALPVIGQGDTPTPEPSPTPLNIPDDEMYDIIGEVDEGLGGISDDLSAPDGAEILPSIDLTQLIGYARWVLSPSTADEVFGVFSPVITPIGLYLGVRFALGAIYVVVYIAIYLIRWVIWIFKLLLELVSAISGIIDLLGGLVGKGLGWLIKFIGG